MKPITPILALLALSLPLHAILDDNSNDLSDVWEEHYNSGALFPQTAPHDPAADPDGDGWTNAEEAVAGTDPFSAILPDGLVKTEITPVPASDSRFVLSWPSALGKNYKLSCSTDLVNWADCPESIPGDGGAISLEVDSVYADGTVPEKHFWRVMIEDEDPDGDSLTSWEEIQLGTETHHPDTDLDGIFDNVDSAPHGSATLADPDGLDLPVTHNNALRGHWDFESPQGYPYNYVHPDSSGANRDADAFSTSANDQLGMPSKAVDIGFNQYLTIPNSTLQGVAEYTISGWFKIGEDVFDGLSENADDARVIFVVYDRDENNQRPPDHPPIGQGTGLFIRKNTNGDELWTVGGYRQTVYHNEPPHINGNPKTELVGNSFVLPEGTTGDGQWHHFAVTRSAAAYGQKVYIDGVRHVNDALIEFPVSFDSDTAITFGRLYDQHFASQIPEASLDRLCVHGRLLSQNEVLEYYHQDIDMLLCFKFSDFLRFRSSR